MKCIRNADSRTVKAAQDAFFDALSYLDLSQTEIYGCLSAIRISPNRARIAYGAIAASYRDE